MHRRVFLSPVHARLLVSTRTDASANTLQPCLLTCTQLDDPFRNPSACNQDEGSRRASVSTAKQHPAANLFSMRQCAQRQQHPSTLRIQ